jgi:hypothetical protein
MPVSLLPQAPHRQDRKVFPTPLIGDVLFSEVRDCNRILIPEYGTPHPDTNKWPNHKLVYVRPVDIDRNEIFEFFYAANRENQDEYNWEVSNADIGGVKFDSVKRVYLFLREDYDALLPAMGTAMPSVPVGKFGTEFVLSSRRQVQSPEQELNSIFIFEERTYIKRSTLVDIEINRETGTAFQITTDYYYTGEIVSGSRTIEELVADRTNAYWALDGNGLGNVAKQLSEAWWEVTQRQWINLEGIRESQVDRRGPDKFYCPQGETTTTTVSLGTYDPVTESDVADGQMISVVQWGNYSRRTDVRRIGSRKVLKGTNFDQRTGEGYIQTEELVDARDVVATAVKNDGTIESYTPYNGCLAIKTITNVASTEIRRWKDIINYEWPPVLKSVRFKTWPKRDGTTVYLPVLDFKQGFTGAQVADVEQYWSLQPAEVIDPTQMIPEGFNYQSIYVTIDCPPCLHGEQTFIANSGTTDPVWKYNVDTETFPATSPADWPESITWTESKPNNGGYLVTKWTVKRPK